MEPGYVPEIAFKAVDSYQFMTELTWSYALGYT